MSMETEIPTRTILGLCKDRAAFKVPSYQRGYRWGPVEVNNLLDDLQKHGDVAGSDGYVLQPLMVAEEDPWIVVDGQQRLTTLLILLHHALSNDVVDLPGGLYTIEYETRTGDYDFLNNWIAKKQADSDGATEAKDKSIDAHYMAQAWETMNKRFSQSKKSFPRLSPEIVVREALQARFIWYQIDRTPDTNTSQHDAFSRANTGKIRLTGGELVKAVYLKADTADDAPKRAMDERVRRWDELEARLHDRDFWGFLSSANSSDTRIDLLLSEARRNCVTRKNDEQAMALFRCYSDLSPTELETAWQDATRHAHVLDDWYGEMRVYHRVGFLNAIGMSVKPGSIKTQTRSELTEELDKRIKRHFSNQMESLPLENLVYGEHSNLIKHLLLLFNVMEEERGGRRFPFADFNDQPMKNWSLEHITAQNEESLSRTSYKSYLNNLRRYALALPGREDSAAAVETLIDNFVEQLDEMDPSRAKDMFDHLLGEIASKMDDLGIQLHSIENLALLHRNHNSSLSNAFFPQKRRKILGLSIGLGGDAEKGIMVPPSTVRVFGKAYDHEDGEDSDEDRLSLGAWLNDDRERYRDRLKSVLAAYLPVEGEVATR